MLDNLSNCLMNLSNTGDSTEFEPMTSAMSMQCSHQLSYEVTQLGAGQFVGLMFSRERDVVRTIDHFTVVCLVAWPLNESEAGVDLVLIETSLLFICKFLLISIRTASLT